MNVYELRIEGVGSESQLAAARWELFIFAEVRQICRIGPTGHVAVLYEGDQPDVAGWLDALRRAGYAADSLEDVTPLDAA